MFLEEEKKKEKKMKRKFEIIYESKKSKARLGKLSTAHGELYTPCFVPVGTNGTLKHLSNEDNFQSGNRVMFCNSYHLMEHPGKEVITPTGG